MAKERTTKHKYQSHYSDSFVTSAQYITEIVCENNIRIKHNSILPDRFWELPGWNKYYKEQIICAHHLLKKYSDTAIIRSLRSREGRSTYSLRAPYLLRLVEEEEKKVKLESKSQAEDVEIPDVNQKPRPKLIKKTGLENLEED